MSGAAMDARRTRNGIDPTIDATGAPRVSKRTLRWRQEEAPRIKFRPSRTEGHGSTYVRKGPKVGRNDPCPCGQTLDGKPIKWKNCCGG